MLILFT